MKQNSFTPQEMVCMALLAGKEHVVGLPDVFAGLSEETMAVMLQDTVDKLLENGTAVMDFDGAVSLQSEYEDLVQFCSGCDSCMTINHQKPDQPFQTRILWRLGNTYRMAEAVGGKYILSQPDEACISSYIAWEGTSSHFEEASPASVPLVFLEKAKRYLAEGSEEEVSRIFRQNAVDEATACVIGDGLGARGELLELRLMERENGQWTQREMTCLSSRGIVLEIGRSVENFRSCMTFTAKDGQEIRKELEKLICAFRAAEEGGGE